MNKIKTKPAFSSMKRPKKSSCGFGRLCNTCGKRFGTFSRLKDHEIRCKNVGFRYNEVVTLVGHHNFRRPTLSMEMIWIPVRSRMNGIDIELWAGIHPCSKNKVFSLKEWPEKSEIVGYFRITREMFDGECKTKDRWKTAVELVSEHSVEASNN